MFIWQAQAVQNSVFTYTAIYVPPAELSLY